jgi:hypothetical protein
LEEASGNLKKALTKLGTTNNAARRKADFQIVDDFLMKLYLLSCKLRLHSANLENKWYVPLITAEYPSPLIVQMANSESDLYVKKAHVSQLTRFLPPDFR